MTKYSTNLMSLLNDYFHAQHLAEREIGLKEKAAKAKAVAEEIDRTKAKEEAVRHAALLVSKGRRVKGSYKHPLGAATTATLTRPIMSGGMVETYRKAAGEIVIDFFFFMLSYD
tara:strand:- start:273 stop:614 length:342 start_codon:yes stop_codon:yes gene_type:complete